MKVRRIGRRIESTKELLGGKEDKRPEKFNVMLLGLNTWFTNNTTTQLETALPLLPPLPPFFGDDGFLLHRLR